MTAGAKQVEMPVVSVNFATWMLNGQRMSRSDHALLRVFVERAGEVVTKRELWNACWGAVPQNNYGRFTSPSARGGGLSPAAEGSPAGQRLGRRLAPARVHDRGHVWLDCTAALSGRIVAVSCVSVRRLVQELLDLTVQRAKRFDAF